MSGSSVLFQQAINGLSLGAMYALLALGFTLVYGILELINFAHFNVFMVSSFAGMWALELLGISGQSHVLTGLALAGALLFAFAVTMLAGGVLGVAIERLAAAVAGCPGPRRDDHDDRCLLHPVQRHPVDRRRGVGELPEPAAGGAVAIRRGHARAEDLVDLGVAVALMMALQLFVNRTRLGKAMRAMAQDAEAARMMGVDVDRVVVTAFFLGSALAGAAALIFGLYYNYTSFIIGYTAGLRAFTAAVLGGIGSVPGAMVGGILIGLIETLGGQLIAVRWTDVIIFSILILVLVFVPTGLFGRAAPTKS